MEEELRNELEADGWRIGTIQEFLGLTDEETAYIEIGFELGRALHARRAELGLNRKRFAARVVGSGFGSPRRRRRHRGRRRGDLDTLVRHLLATGATPQEIGAIIASADPTKPPERPLVWLEEEMPAD